MAFNEIPPSAADAFHRAVRTAGASPNDPVALDAALQASQDYARDHHSALDSVRKLTMLASHMQDEEGREKVIAAALAQNAVVAKLDEGFAVQNLHAMNGLTQAGGANDQEVAAQMSRIADNPMYAPIGAFRLSSDNARHTAEGTIAHDAALLKTAEYYDRLDPGKKHEVRAELLGKHEENPLPAGLMPFTDASHDARTAIDAIAAKAEGSWAKKHKSRAEIAAASLLTK